MSGRVCQFEGCGSAALPDPVARGMVPGGVEVDVYLCDRHALALLHDSCVAVSMAVPGEGEARLAMMPDAVTNLERLLAEAAPGPWTVDRTPFPTYWIYQVLASDGFPIRTQGVEPFDEFELATADLIAAAPLLAKHLVMLAQALRLTAEYADLPAVEGWSWFDALAAFERDFGGGEA